VPRQEGEKEDKPEEKGKGKETSEASTSTKAPSGTLYTAMSGDALLENGGLTDRFHMDSGASDHLIPTKGDLRAYKEFTKPVEISVANNGKIYAHSTGTLHVAASANGLEREQDLEDVYYAPGIHARLVSLGELEGQGWDVRLREGGMEPRNRDGDMFTNIERVNNVYLMVLEVVPPGLCWLRGLMRGQIRLARSWSSVLTEWHWLLQRRDGSVLDDLA
jgi:hypothetical protein